MLPLFRPPTVPPLWESCAQPVQWGSPSHLAGEGRREGAGFIGSSRLADRGGPGSDPIVGLMDHSRSLSPEARDRALRRLRRLTVGVGGVSALGMAVFSVTAAQT